MSKDFNRALSNGITAGREDSRWMRERIAKLEDKLFALGAMERPPCFCCGYNGPGYYNSKMHPCAKRHHELKESSDG